MIREWDYSITSSDIVLSRLNLMSRNLNVLELGNCFRWLNSSLSRETIFKALLDDAWFLRLACWSPRLIYLPAATRIPITNFPRDIAFRALHHHWKVLFSQELTSFPKNRAELRCRASRRARDDVVVVVVAGGGCMQFCKLELNLLRREKGGRFDPLAENASRWREGNGAPDAANEIIKTSTPCISDDESRYQRRQARGRKLIHTRHLAYLLICPRKPLLEFLSRERGCIFSRDPFISHQKER